MALAVDSQESSNAGHNATNPATTLSWSFNNVAGTILVVGANAESTGTGSSAAITGVTYNSVALTKAGSQGWAGTGPSSEVSIWYLLNPATGSNTVSVSASFANTTVTDIIGGAISFTGNATSTPFGTAAGAKLDTGAGSTSPSVTVNSTTANNYVLAMMGTGTGYSSTSNTLTWSLNVSTNMAGDNSAMTYQLVSGSSTTMTDTVTQDWWGIVAAELKAAGTAGGIWYMAGMDSGSQACIGTCI